MAWEVSLHDAVDSWFVRLSQDEPEIADQVAAAIDKLEADGPTLGRPLVDRIKQSKHHNMKELRPRTDGETEIRILFAFDLEREAILLVAGDKTGTWNKWYDENVPVADARFDEHLKRLNEGEK
ncbi:type II toxin-antitoxin system RelE/ParE family toxin [Kitasatospora sp. CM 4170]|uniref:Type II toxin-antitoxin system RelE/ParE family toxin n=1 Tax=Kitasatospora aburaviensis TaxID=67265 RepID=A0ABW1EU21_9ACTN|nr:type II toxin-antitoxin system RelE/ParE family toxin [Kitasatospora sp. CM 4170]WNM46367.1 type II toxin-antitoxin system RelE/ParE family toxin [Kitasatospora sp. CM 4170]